MVRVCSQRVSPIRKEVLRDEGRGKLLNRSRIGKCKNHHQLIMRAERNEKSQVLVSHILCNPYQLYFTCPEVYSSHRCAAENIQFTSKHPVAMNSVFPGMFPPLTHSVIKSGCSACILFTSQAYALFVVSSCKPGLIEIPASGPYRIHRTEQVRVAPWQPPRA
jgi:hypothetical protein